MCRSVSICGHVHTSAVPVESEEVVGSLGTEATGGHETPAVGAGDQTHFHH